LTRDFLEVVIPAFNGQDLISDCLSSVMKRLPGTRITVVNDKSSDLTAKIVSEDFPSVKIIHNGSNIGFGQSCNIGAFQSKSEWVLLLNQDAILHNIDLDLVRAITSESDVAVIGGRTEYQNGALLPNIGLFPSLSRFLIYWPTLPLRFLGINIGGLYETNPLLYSETADVQWITGSCLIVRRDLFEQQGGFDKKYFIYVEEVEHAYRSIKSGYRVVFEPSIVSMHENRSGLGMSSFAVFQTIRGQRIFIESNYGKFLSSMLMLFACSVSITFGITASILLWWSPKKRLSAWGLLRGGFRALFSGWGSIAGP